MKLDDLALPRTITPGRDNGLPERVEPCRLTTWCQLAHDHEPPCVETPRRPIAPSDFGPNARPRWAK